MQVQMMEGLFFPHVVFLYIFLPGVCFSIIQQCYLMRMKCHTPWTTSSLDLEIITSFATCFRRMLFDNKTAKSSKKVNTVYHNRSEGMRYRRTHNPERRPVKQDTDMHKHKHTHTHTQATAANPHVLVGCLHPTTSGTSKSTPNFLQSPICHPLRREDLQVHCRMTRYSTNDGITQATSKHQVKQATKNMAWISLQQIAPKRFGKTDLCSKITIILVHSALKQN